MQEPKSEPITEQETRTRRLPVRWMLGIAALVVIVPWLLYTPAGITGKADAIGYAVCHQIPARSFQINGQPISLCARCTGMYVGIFVGLAYQLLTGRRRAEWPGKFKLIVFAAFFLAFAVDGSNSASALFFGRGLLYEPSNLMRLITGTGMGLTMAGMVLPTFNQTIWKEYAPDPRPVFCFLGPVWRVPADWGGKHHLDPNRNSFRAARVYLHGGDRRTGGPGAVVRDDCGHYLWQGKHHRETD